MKRTYKNYIDYRPKIERQRKQSSVAPVSISDTLRPQLAQSDVDFVVAAKTRCIDAISKAADLMEKIGQAIGNDEAYKAFIASGDASKLSSNWEDIEGIPEYDILPVVTHMYSGVQDVMAVMDAVMASTDINAGSAMEVMSALDQYGDLAGKLLSKCATVMADSIEDLLYDPKEVITILGTAPDSVKDGIKAIIKEQFVMDVEDQYLAWDKVSIFPSTFKRELYDTALQYISFRDKYVTPVAEWALDQSLDIGTSPIERFFDAIYNPMIAKAESAKDIIIDLHRVNTMDKQNYTAYLDAVRSKARTRMLWRLVEEGLK